MTENPSTEPSTRICAYCGKEFVPVTSWQKCCPVQPGQKKHQSCGHKAWRRDHAEQYRDSQRAWAKRNKKKIRAFQADNARKRRAADPEAHNKYIRDRRHANPEHHAKVRAAWIAKNPKKLKMYRKRAYKKNAEKIKARSRDYTAKRAAKLAEAKSVLAQRAKSGRPPHTALFIKAEELHSQNHSWPRCAEILIPAEAKEDRRAAGEKLRVGVEGRCEGCREGQRCDENQR